MRNKVFIFEKLFVTILFFVSLLVGIKAVSNSVSYRDIILGKTIDGNKILEIIRSWPNPKATEEVLVLAMKNLNNCPFVEAASDELLNVDSRSGQALYIKALCADAKGDQEQALIYVQRAVELQPFNFVYLEAKVRLEFRLGSLESAKMTLNKLLGANADYEGIKELKDLLGNS